MKYLHANLKSFENSFKTPPLHKILPSRTHLTIIQAQFFSCAESEPNSFTSHIQTQLLICIDRSCWYTGCDYLYAVRCAELAIYRTSFIPQHASLISQFNELLLRITFISQAFPFSPIYAEHLFEIPDAHPCAREINFPWLRYTE